MSLDSVVDDGFRILVESSPTAIIMTSGDGVVQFANAEAERMFGYRMKELIGNSIDILLPERLRRTHAFARQTFLLDPIARPMGAGRDVVGARRDGVEFPIEVGLTPAQTRTGLVILATIFDLTARRKVEKALAQRAAELERANEQLIRFAYLAANDLQEPLRKIAAFSDLLQNAIASFNQTEMTTASQVMRISARHARKLVDDLLTYSRTMYGGQELEVIDLQEAIQGTLAHLSKSISETNAELKIKIPAMRLLADRSQFARLLQNIVANAIKYRKPGHTPKIDIAAVPMDDSSVRLTIVDYGVGFEEEFAHTIFEPFKRLPNKAQYPGTGIELAICKSIADRHGWGISVRSRPGEGATFFITIPTFATVPTLGQ